MSASKYYRLTETAASDFRAAKRWSLARWGAALTKDYFTDLHKAAEHIAQNLAGISTRDDLTGDLGLCVHPVREHYMVYVPAGQNAVIIMALIRQSRNVPEILKASAFKIRRALQDGDNNA